jgi:predicted transcriptional regulator of viral defense system
MKYNTSSLAGLGKKERAYLATVLQAIDQTISPAEAATILSIPQKKAGDLLAHYARKGWLARICSGVYVPIPIEADTTTVIPEEPLIIAKKLYSPCYIAGWSAAEYWDMTEQIFQSVVVVTQKQQKNYQPTIKNIQYLLHVAKKEAFFGLKTVWQNNSTFQISDPTRTIVDLLKNPTLGGGIRVTIDILKNYFLSEKKSNTVLIKYLKRLNQGAAYKRLGFLLEKYFPKEEMLINECQKNLTKGNAKLDFTLDCDTLVTKWRLLVPRVLKRVHND